MSAEDSTPVATFGEQQEVGLTSDPSRGAGVAEREKGTVPDDSIASNDVNSTSLRRSSSLFTSSRTRWRRRLERKGRTSSSRCQFHRLLAPDPMADCEYTRHNDIPYRRRAKLFIFGRESKEWKERGTGDLRLLSASPLLFLPDRRTY